MKRRLADKLYDEIAFAVTEAYDSELRISVMEKMLHDRDRDLFNAYMDKVTETKRLNETANTQLVARLERLKHFLDTENSFFT